GRARPRPSPRPAVVAAGARRRSAGPTWPSGRRPRPGPGPGRPVNRSRPAPGPRARVAAGRGAPSSPHAGRARGDPVFAERDRPCRAGTAVPEGVPVRPDQERALAPDRLAPIRGRLDRDDVGPPELARGRPLPEVQRQRELGWPWEAERVGYPV